jgi:hypothetical protein
MEAASFPSCLTEGVHPTYLRLSAFICGPYGFSNSANALQSSQAAEIVAPREEFGVQ